MGNMMTDGVDVHAMSLTPENELETGLSCIAPRLNLRTMPRVIRTSAYMVVPLLRVSDRSYTSHRALDRHFEPL